MFILRLVDKANTFRTSSIVSCVELSEKKK